MMSARLVTTLLVLVSASEQSDAASHSEACDGSLGTCDSSLDSDSDQLTLIQTMKMPTTKALQDKTRQLPAVSLESTGKHYSEMSAPSAPNMSASSSTKWDDDLQARACLPEWMEETGTPLETVCSDDPNNNIKDDKGNYIQFTRREDRLMYNVYKRAVLDCSQGESYVRDIVASFAERTSCFANETAMLDEDFMYIPVKVLNTDGSIVDSGDKEKVLCTGDKKTANQTELDGQLALLKELVDSWDQSTDSVERLEICQTMLAAHMMHKFGFIGVLHSTRPAACKQGAPYYDASLCEAAETYLTEFQSRDLFVNVGEGFKGRAEEGENARAEKCKDEMLNGEKWNHHLTTNPGITRADDPVCTIPQPVLKVYPEPVLKVGVYHENIADNMIADAYRQCGCPFVAGISATMPQYLASVAAGPTKKGMKYQEAASLKEIFVVMSMLELGGFHALTGISLSVNYYLKELLVTPPFDSGSFDANDHSDDGAIRCHDTVTSCCTNASKVHPPGLYDESAGFYNTQSYLNMMGQFESLYTTTFLTQHFENSGAFSTGPLGMLIFLSLMSFVMSWGP